MKTTWHYRDIIDLEYFLRRDQETDEDVLHVRDRGILLERENSPVDKKDLSRAHLIRLWLDARIAREFPGDERRSPGAIFADSHFVGKNLAAAVGVLAGLFAGLSFFAYTGTTPVNVFHFLLLFVASQLGLAALLGCGWLLRLLLPRVKPPSFYTLLFRGMLARLASLVHGQWQRSLTPDKRASLGQAFGMIRARSAVYGSLFYWPLFSLAQLLAIGFNIGLLATTLVKITTSDLAFGWQSTLQVSGEALQRMVQLAALPWSWLPIAGSYPTLAEIEGSRIILKEGIYHLATRNLVAWWPFLVMSLVVYGLLLRLGLFALGKAAERRALRRLDLDTAAVEALRRRMMTPLISSQAPPEVPKTAREDGAGREAAAPRPVPAAGSAEIPSFLPQVVLIPDDIFGICPPEKLAPLLHCRGLAIKSVHTFMTGYEEDEELKTILADSCQGADEGIFILMEGWMPPLVAFLTYLRELREVLPEKTMIHLGLVGRPVRSGFTPLTPQQLKLWRKKLAAIGDPYLHTFPLTP